MMMISCILALTSCTHHEEFRYRQTRYDVFVEAHAYSQEDYGALYSNTVRT
jgi:hypothetical protein